MEIEITPEMIAAGVEAYYLWHRVDDDMAAEIVENVFIAMLGKAVATQQPDTKHQYRQ